MTGLNCTWPTDSMVTGYLVLVAPSGLNCSRASCTVLTCV